MTTKNDDILDRQAKFGNQVYEEGVYPTGYQDPSGVYPRSAYYYESSINKASRGMIRNTLSTNGGIPTLKAKRNYSESSEIPEEFDETRNYSTYPHNQVIETPGGHVIELDDTLTNERILVRHQSGAGIEIKPDGTVYVSSTSDVLLTKTVPSGFISIPAPDWCLIRMRSLVSVSSNSIT